MQVRIRSVSSRGPWVCLLGSTGSTWRQTAEIGIAWPDWVKREGYFNVASFEGHGQCARRQAHGEGPQAVRRRVARRHSCMICRRTEGSASMDQELLARGRRFERVEAFTRDIIVKFGAIL